MGDHAKLSPSAASRWMNCPGSVALCEGIPDPSSREADEGTFAHEIAARILADDGLVGGADAFRGHVSDCERFTVDADMAEHIQRYIDAVRAQQLMCDGKLYVEHQVVAALFDVWGTADAIIEGASEVHVMDLKFGRGVWVDARDNLQLMIYAVGAWQAVEFSDDIETVTMHIVQPRHGGSTRWWRTHTVSTDELLRFVQHVLTPAVAATRESTPPLVPGESQCRWCPAKAICPALRDSSLTKAQAAFDRPMPDLAKLPPEEITKALRAFPMIEQWMDAVRHHAYEQARKGVEIPGYKLVRKTANRKWLGNDEETRLALRDAGLTDPYADRKLLSPAQAEKKIGGAKGKRAVAKLAAAPDAGVVLAPESDSRPAWKPAAAFPVVTDEESKNG